MGYVLLCNHPFNASMARADDPTVRTRRATLTWSLSATSIPANPPLLVSQPPDTSSQAPNYTETDYNITGHLIYKCGGIDQRTIEKFEKVNNPPFLTLLSPFCCTIFPLHPTTGEILVLLVGCGLALAWAAKYTPHQHQTCSHRSRQRSSLMSCLGFAFF